MNQVASGSLWPLLKSGRAMTLEEVIATAAITEADCRLE